jgi:hypothetical protein
MVASVSRPTGISKNGLILNLDASNTSSYPGTGTTWTDLTGNATATIFNGGSYSINWVSAGQASYFNFGSQDTNFGPTKTYIGSSNAQNYLTVTIVFAPDFTLNTSTGLTGLLATSTGGTGNSDKSLRFQNANGTGPWSFNSSPNNDDWDNTVPTWYKNNTVYTGTSGSVSTGWNILTTIRTNTTNGNFTAPFNYYLGCGGYSGDNRNFKGKIALVLGYNRLLTAAEQLENYTALRNRFGV